MLAPKRIYVLLLEAGTENEGIHTKKMGDIDKVLMFESEDDATRFSLMLEAQDYPETSVVAFPSDEIEAFCREAGYECELVEEGRLEIPPEGNVEELDYSKGSSEPASATPETESEIPTPELDDIRRRLEGLL
ncbi:DUF3110 domain-containing protein [Lusitaniella coriacea]|uniref:DUF3110 domain-containing protein n=1 Tax=Lusitaniella coriacea TaxID=1983105 RepID=UPI003CF731D7